MKKILLLSFGLFWGQFIYGQKHIDTVTVTPTSVCAGSAISVRVAYTSAYNGGTDDAFSFLSDLNGNGYNSSNLINQHALSSTTFTFSYTIPLGTTAGNYRIFTKDTIALNQVDTFSNLFTVIAPATANAGSPQSVCQGGSVTLAGAIGGSATGATWSAPSGSFSNTTNLSSPYTPSITSGTVTLTLTTAGPCAAVTSTVVITVNATSTANAGSPQSVCQGGTVTLAGTKGGSATGSTWSAPSGSFSNTSLLNSTYTPSITTGTVTLTLTTSGPCAAATSTVVITVNPSATANAGSPQTLCAGGNVTLSGSIGGSATGSTWSAPSGSFSNASLLNSSYTPSISTGTVTLTLTTSGPCAAATSTVVITVNATSTANAGSPQSVCQGGAVTLAGSIGGSATGSTWSAPSGSFSDVNLLNSTYTPSITTGTVTLTLTTSGPCAAATSTVVITVNATSTANAGSPQTVCQGGTVTLAGSRGGSATGSTWSAPSGSFSSATSLTSNYTPSITTGTVTLTLTTSGPCAAATSTVVITVNPTATANAGSPQTVCQGGTVTLAGTRGGSATGSTWSASSGSFSVASSLTSQYTPSITTGSITLTLTTSGPCAPVTSTVVITVNPNATANAGSSQSVCLGGTLTLAGTINGSATGSTWSAPSGSFSNTSSLTSTYTPSITSGNITLTLTTSGPCAPATNTMVVTIDPPALVNAGNSATICKGTPYALTGSSIGGSATTGTWSITASTGTMTTSSSQLSSTSPTANPSSIVFSPNGNNTGTVTLTLTTNKPAGPCNAVSSSIIITISNAPTSNAGSNTTICSGSGYALAGSNIGGAATTGTWSISAVTGTMTNASSQLSNLAPTNTPSSVIFTPISTNSGTVTLTLTTDDPAGPCPAATNTVVLTVDLAPTVNAGSPNTLCSGNPYSLSGSNIGGGASTGVWSITSVTGTMTNASSQLSNITPTATPSSVIFTPIASNSGTVTLTLSTNDPFGPCGIVTNSVTFIVNPAATVNAGIPATVCAGIAYPLTGSGIGGGATTGTWSITAVTGTMTTAASQLSNTAATAAPSLVTFTAALLNSGTVTLTLTTDDPAGPCNSVSTTLSLTINPAPPKPVFNASNPVSVCYNQQGVNYAITALPNTNYLWSSTDPSVRFYGKRTPNCLIDFPSSGSPFKIYVTAINPTTGCRDSSFVNLSTTGITPTFAKVIATNNNKTLVCLDNSQSTFQWGFDNTTFIGTDVTGATLQDFTPLGGIDPTKNYYVKLNSGGCNYKVYYNAPLAISTSSQTTKISLQPNPNAGSFKLMLEGHSTSENGIITDILGNQVALLKLQTGMNEVHIENLPGGIYFLQIINSFGNRQSLKFIINK